MGFDKKIVNELPMTDEEIYNTEAVTKKGRMTMGRCLKNIKTLILY